MLLIFFSPPPILGSTPNGLDCEFAREKPFGLARTPAAPNPLHTLPIQGSPLSPFARTEKWTTSCVTTRGPNNSSR
ncbi:hypothetical protein D623_10007069 [Myotis brandtii]|uniref:Uncharacterized protein n=1 Tax=Myotis brandtii TaxID=109478 RepID=S7MLK2_MYOBR|nr:hypothetical protein D623_10007069 [Myotis brandtii]